MADFMTNLWESIFTPGTTPTLLVATNATFAALQLVLVALLFATYSIHFAVLSVLCGGLWASINWFATELTKANEEAARAKENEKEDRGRLGSVDDSGTETEEVSTVKKDVGAKGGLSTGREKVDDVTKRRSVGDTEASTDSEWDKVESEIDA